MEPPWWPAAELREDPRFRVSDHDGNYLDYDADLSIEEARELHARFKPKAAQGVFGFDDWQDLIQPMLRELDLALGNGASGFSRFHVCVFEWESGLT